MSLSNATTPETAQSARLTSMDAFRGFVMICLAANGFGLRKASQNFPDCSIWQSIGYQFDHVAWVGCAFWDLIQPSFMFLVGVALPYSYSRREATGESSGQLWKHVIIRSVVLVLLGIFLSSTGTPTTNFTFMNVLTQIGLGYSFLYLFRNQKFMTQVIAAVMILGSYWAWFALTPAVAIENPKEQNLPENWVLLKDFEAHWQKNANPAASFDRWFLNLFPAKSVPAVQDKSKVNASADPAEKTLAAAEEDTKPGVIERIGACFRRLVTRPEPYVFNAGGYQTLNFIPSLVTMLFGLMTGEFIRRTSTRRIKTFATLVLSGLVLLALGWGWQAIGGCPLVKRIWTPSWTLFSTGLVLLILSAFYGIIDCLGFRAWSFPLVVAGMNSMLLYLMGQLVRGWTSDLLKRHLNENLFNIFGAAYAPIVEANLVLLCFWLIVFWLYRQKVFIRI